MIKSHLKYLREVEQLSPASVQRTWFWLRHLLLWADETPLSRVVSIRPAFPAYCTSLPGLHGKKVLAAVSQKKMIAAAKRFFLWAKSMGYQGFAQIPATWIETLRPARNAVSSGEHVYVTVDEAIILATFPVDPSNLALRRDQAAAAMLFLSGARSSAFVSLPIQAVNIQAAYINQWPELGVKTKNRKRATSFLLPIPELFKVVTAWDQFVKAQLDPTSPWYATIENHWGDQKLLVSSPGEYRNQLLTKRLRKLFEAAGLPYKSAHKFRHGHAVYGLQHAQTMADYKAVSLNLMHEDIKVTDEIYAPILSDEVQLRINRLTEHRPAPKENEIETLLRGMSNNDLSAVMRVIAERLAE